MEVKQINLKKVIAAVLAVFMMSYSFNNVRAFADNEEEYLIRINAAMNCITIYGKNNVNEYTVPVKTMACSANSSTVETEISYTVIGREEWKQSSDGTYSQYAVNLDEVISICSSPYSSKTKSSLITEEYNGLGNDYAAENIWINCRDAKWIYDNCTEGTVVQIYSDAKEAGPGGKPDSIKIPQDSEYAGWDPTDAAAENPWKTKNARIEGVNNIVTLQGVEADLLRGLKAYDTCGNDVTENLLIMGTYDFDTAGTYTITYYLMDAIGSQASESISLTVEKNTNVNGHESTEGSYTGQAEGEKTNREKTKIIIILGMLSLGAAYMLIKRSRNE